MSARVPHLRRLSLVAVTFAPIATPATAQDITLKPLAEMRTRYEDVSQDGTAREAQALTTRIKAGVTASDDDWVALVEANALLSIDGDYNSTTNGKTQFPLVTDPQTVGLHRAQLTYRGISKTAITVGRQYVGFDDERFIGRSLWRQNEQVFDAARVSAEPIKGLKLEAVYIWNDQTIYGIDGSGARPGSVRGDNFLLHGSYALPIGTLTGFAYLIDQDSPLVYTKSSQTYGARFAGNHRFARQVKLDYALSYARQSEYGRNPNDYRANYYFADATLDLNGPAVGGGYEVLGADKGKALTSFATPLSSLNRWNGWADVFLVTPPNGLRDAYASAGYTWKKAGPFTGVNASATYHRFDSDRSGLHYGDEWDANLSGRIGRYSLMARYARYSADGFSVDTRKFWLSIGWAFGPESGGGA